MKNKTDKIIQLKTKQLIISPMDASEMQQMIDSEEQPELKAAYKEMLDNSIADAANRLWYVMWKICMKGSGEMIGNTCFKGPQENYSVEIGYGMNQEYQGRGLMTEAVAALTDWAFGQENVYFIEAETDAENIASQKLLEKLEFQPDGEGEEGLRFVLEKPMTQWMPIYMLFGMSIGMSLGSLRENLSIGMCIGMAFGLCIGTSMDSAAKKKRQEIREKRNNNGKLL